MIIYLKHKQIDINKWDECIANSVNSYIYAYSWYLNIVAGEWDALIEDDYKSVFPLPFRKKYGINYIYQPALTQQIGLFSKEAISASLIHNFIMAIPEEFSLAEINLNKYNPIENNEQYKIVENINIELDLSPEYDVIKKSYSKNLKRNIAKAKKNSLSIHNNVKPELILDLFKKNKGSEVKSFSKDDYKRILRLIYVLINNHLIDISAAFSKENNLLGGLFIIKDSKRYIFIFSGLSEEGKEKAAMPFLINEYIKSHSNRDMIFDFEGSNTASIARFFKSFGASEYHYPALRYYRLNKATRIILKLLGRI
ncbi:MAG: hypothetical protein KAG84_07725 [Bacteroidales bacterium]|nr:hypothetical protein [Bacteroidales bacterium]